MTVLPRVTWPSPPMAMAPLRRTARMVVPWGLNWGVSLMSRSARLARERSPPDASDFFPLARSRVTGFVDAGQVLEVKVGIDLGRGQAGVPEHLLHATKILTGFKNMRGKGVTEEVRMHGDVEAPGACPVGHPKLHGPGTQARAIAPQEERSLAPLRDRRPLLEPLRQRRGRLAPDGDDPLFPALAGHADGAVRLQGVDLQRDELREAQTRGIEQFHDGAIPGREDVVGRHLQQARHPIHVQRPGELTAGFRIPDLASRIALDREDHRILAALDLAARPDTGQLLAQKKVVEAAHRGQAPLNAAWPHP